jgi:uncharacterized protein YcfJ
MKKSTLVCALGLLAAVGAQAQEVGRVLSSTPIYQQVAVPRQVCSQQPMVMQQGTTGGGGVMGALIGGVLGNAMGGGSGRAAATALGIVGGAMVGNSAEANAGYQTHNVQQCSTQTYYENRAVGYNVTYEYAGRQYQAQMPHDPGPSIQLQVTPVGASNMGPDSYGTAPPPAPQDQAMMMAPPQPGYVVTAPQFVPPVYYQPRPYYYPPVGISLNLGYSRGHRHWR